MMGRQKRRPGKLFYYQFSLEDRVRANHPLRKIAELVDFDFAYTEVQNTYGHNGKVSVPPPVILKLMLLLVLYNVRSERELMQTLPERLDWLWFLGFDLDQSIPNHSVLSRARKRWGTELFQRFFERIVEQCVAAGLVDGSKLFIDSSLIDANASPNSVVDTRNLTHQLQDSYKQLESRLSEQEASSKTPGPHSTVNKRYISATDPDAAIIRRGKPKLCHQIHRAVDEENEIITATKTTAGDVNEAHELLDLVEQHEQTTGCATETVVADSKYGTIDNFLACHDRGLQAHIPDLHHTRKTKKRQKFFDEERFRYDREADVYICPRGTIMPRKAFHRKRRAIDYGAPRKACASCELRSQCTKNKAGRTIKRHVRHDELEAMRQASRSKPARQDIKKRQHLVERSFARGQRLGIKRARWRGLWRMAIQEYLTCIVQNIQVLIARYGRRRKVALQAMTIPVGSSGRLYGSALELLAQRSFNGRTELKNRMAFLVNS